MAKRYKQLSLRERIEIEWLSGEGQSTRAIARKLGRSASTISRELRRNSKKTKAWAGGYEAQRAEGLAHRRRRWDGRYKLQRQPHLRARVRAWLEQGWSPEQIAGRLKRQIGQTVISHESIYRYIYHRSAQKDYWHRLLPQAKHRRGRIKRGGRSLAQTIPGRESIHQRPQSVQSRADAGHWEADLMLFAKYGQAILFSHERRTRLLLATRQPSKAAEPVAHNLMLMLGPLPAQLRQTITFDNGPEFAKHQLLNAQTQIQTYFCDPYAPWQKGGIENALARMRRKLPRKTDLACLSQQQLDELVCAYNNTPRKCLDFQTPAEVFSDQLNVLHFKRESTFPFSRE